MVKQLLPGFVISFIIAFAITFAAGVNPEVMMANVIGGVMSFIFTTLMNCLVSGKMAAKGMGKKVSIGKILLIALPYLIIAAVVGFVFMQVILVSLLHINLCVLSKVVNALIVGFASAIMATVAAALETKKITTKF